MNRKIALTAAFAAGVALAPFAADAAFFNLTGGTPFETTSGNDVLGAGTTLLDSAELSTTENNVSLTVYFLGSESGFKNTLNVAGSTHTEVDNPPYPASWPGSPVIGPVTQAMAGPVDMFFTSSGFSGQLQPGLGDSSKSIAFAYLADTSGPTTSATPTDVVLFSLDDGGSRADGDYDDYVGYVVAEPVVPTPIPAALPLFVTALVGLGVIGRRRIKAVA